MDEFVEQKTDKATLVRQEIEKVLPSSRASKVSIEVRGRAGGLTKVWLRTNLRRTQPGAGPANVGTE